MLAKDAQTAAQMVIDALTSQSAVALMDAALADDRIAGTSQIKNGDTSIKQDHIAYPVSSSAVLHDALTEPQASTHDGTKLAVQIALKLSLPLVALGASAATYYPAIAGRLGAELVVPDHASVAGAIGAAAGAVRQRVAVLITQPSNGVFRVHLAKGLQDVKDRKEAFMLARAAAEMGARERARSAGATDELVVSLSEEIVEVPIGPNKKLFLQAVITAEAITK